MGVNGGFIESVLQHHDNKPVVDKRICPADPPGKFPGFTEWLTAATEPYGFKRHLARFLGLDHDGQGGQRVQRWIDGYLPASPEIHKAIAKWAHVDYDSLRDLIDKTRATRESARAETREKKANRAKGIARKTASHRRALGEY